MKRLIKLTFFAVLCLSTSVLGQTSSSKWQAQPIVIDGNGADWGTLPRFFNSEANVKYEFRNDDQNLYIVLKAADRATQMQLMAAGFNIRLKVKTSPPIKVGITFPAIKKAEMPSMQMNGEGRTEKLVDKSASNPDILAKDTAILDGFQFAKGIITSDMKDGKNICFAKSKTGKELVTYEISIPLREIYGNDYKLDNVTATAIQLQVNINDLSQNEMRKMRGRMGGGRGEGMRGGGERGMGGGMNRGGMNGEGGMEGGGIGGSEIGEMPGQGMESEMQSRAGFSMERKSFSIDFKLSTGK